MTGYLEHKKNSQFLPFLGASLLPLKGSVKGDFNNSVSFGIYYFTDAVILLNAPAGATGHGILFVFGWEASPLITNPENCIQILAGGYNSIRDKIYIRSMVQYGANWSEWKEIS